MVLRAGYLEIQVHQESFWGAMERSLCNVLGRQSVQSVLNESSRAPKFGIHFHSLQPR